jgi:hypothetical protein
MDLHGAVSRPMVDLSEQNCFFTRGSGWTPKRTRLSISIDQWGSVALENTATHVDFDRASGWTFYPQSGNY